jgi:dipeptidyl aminopeptidase/acylaminoacyl peptidase
MRTLPLALVAISATALLSAAPVLAKPADAPAPLFEGRDLFGLQWATDPQISPDGRTIAYVRQGYDVMTDQSVRAIWLIDVASGVQSALVSKASTPRWSPDGKRLAYVATESGRAQLFVRWMQGGTAASITDLIESPDSLAWSRDGKSIAFTMFQRDEPVTLGSAPPKPEGAKWADGLDIVTDIIYRADGVGQFKPGYTHLFVVSADGGAPRQLTFGEFNETGPLAWSADGRFVYVTGNRMPGWQREPVNTEIYRVSIEEGAMTAVTSRKGPDAQPVVSPDGKAIAYLTFEDKLLGYQNVELNVMEPDGRNPHSLTATLDRTIDNALWAADGRSLYVQYADKGITRIGRLALNGKIEPVATGISGSGLDRPYSGGEFTVSRTGVVAFTLGDGVSPSDVAVARNGKTTRLTHLNDELFRDKTLGKVTPLEVKSSYDRKPIDAWLVTPPRFDPNRKYPLILEIHGGPFASYGPYFSTDYQLYAAAGYVVAYSNPRGSTSYGEAFANTIHHAYPGNDYDDLMSVIDAAVARGVADPKNLFVTGGSGGGILTAWIVGRTDRFRAAAAQKPVINWISTVLTTDAYTFMPKYWFAKLPWESPEEYWKRSPLSLVGSVKTPTLVVVGDHDLRTPVADSEQYYQALQLRGVPTALVKVPGASHGGLAARPSQSAAKASAILAWFDRYRQK